MKKNLFIDMDGTVAEWNSAASLDDVSTPGYFRERNPMWTVIKGVEMLKSRFNLIICSAALQDNHSVADKKAWLEKHMPFIDLEKAIFVPYGISKFKSLERAMKELNLSINEGDVFLDDFTKNLVDMRKKSGGKIIPVKLCNGINDSNRSWDGYRVSSASTSFVIAMTLLGISEIGSENERTAKTA